MAIVLSVLYVGFVLFSMGIIYFTQLIYNELLLYYILRQYL